MNTQQEIKELKEALEKIGARIDKLEKGVKGKDNGFEMGDIYYYIDTISQVIGTTWDGGEVDQVRQLLGNAFKTKEQAIKHRDRMQLEGELRQFAKGLNNGVEIDWNDSSQEKYYLYYHAEDQEIRYSSVGTVKYLGNIYCLDYEFESKAIAKFRRERLIDLFKED